MMRARTRARGADGWMYAKSSTNSFSLWLMSTRFEYAPCAVCSSTSIWICGGPPGGSLGGPFGGSAMRTVYTTDVPGRVIGIDLGARRIGVAMTDGLGLTAQPLETIPRRGGQRDLDAIAALVRTHGAERIVMGL